MKTIFKVFLLFISAVASDAAFGQQLDSFSFLGNRFNQAWEPKSIQISLEGSANSNVINTTMFSDILLRSSFTAKAKQTFLDGDKKRVNLHTRAFLRAEYKLNKKWGIYTSAASMTGYTGKKPISELFFFGNAAHMNTTLQTNNLRFLRYSGYAAGASYRICNTKTFQSKLSFGLNAVSDYRSVSAKEMSLYTAPKGEYIDVITQDFMISEKKTNSPQGIGVVLDFDVDYHFNKKQTISVSIHDLNMTRLFDISRLNLDTNFRFTGIGYDLVRDTNSLNQYIDSNYLSVLDNARSPMNWVSLPSRIHIAWKYKINEKSTLIADIRAIDLGRYGISGTLGLSQKFSKKFELYSSLGYGNFTGLLWQESAEYRFNNFNLFATIQGLQSLFIPTLTHNYGMRFGFSRTLP